MFLSWGLTKLPNDSVTRNWKINSGSDLKMVTSLANEIYSYLNTAAKLAQRRVIFFYHFLLLLYLFDKTLHSHMFAAIKTNKNLQASISETKHLFQSFNTHLQPCRSPIFNDWQFSLPGLSDLVLPRPTLTPGQWGDNCQRGANQIC